MEVVPQASWPCVPNTFQSRTLGPNLISGMQICERAPIQFLDLNQVTTSKSPPSVPLAKAYFSWGCEPCMQCKTMHLQRDSLLICLVVQGETEVLTAIANIIVGTKHHLQLLHQFEIITCEYKGIRQHIDQRNMPKVQMIL